MQGATYAPWTPEQVEALNNYQTKSGWHPFTCGNDRMDDAHRASQAEHGGDFGQLVATTDGWKCPACDYTQDWAHNTMTRPWVPTPEDSERCPKCGHPTHRESGTSRREYLCCANCDYSEPGESWAVPRQAGTSPEVPDAVTDEEVWGLIATIKGGEPPLSTSNERFDKIRAWLGGFAARVISVNESAGLPHGSALREIADLVDLRGPMGDDPKRVVKNVRGLRENYDRICDRLQTCVQKHHLGLGGEQIDQLVVEEIDFLSESMNLIEEEISEASGGAIYCDEGNWFTRGEGTEEDPDREGDDLRDAIQATLERRAQPRRRVEDSK